MVINKKNLNEKIITCIQRMLLDPKVNLPYYAEFNMHINFHETESIGTCAVNFTKEGMNFYWSPSFLDNRTEREVNFVVLHEDFHLLFDHPKRTVSGQYDHKLANIVQDMIINYIIISDIKPEFVEIPKDEDGKNMALFPPKEYTSKLIFEELYEYMKEEKDKYDKEQKDKGDSQEQGSECDGEGGGEGDYGPFGKNPKDDGSPLDTWSKEKIFRDMMNGEGGDYLDKHMENEVSDEYRDTMVRDIMDKLQARGLSTGNIEQTLEKLRKKKKDYLKEIKRNLSTMTSGTIKEKTIVKPNRRQISGVKGNRKIKPKINVLVDVSGSMSGLHEKVFNYIYKNNVELNLIMCDTEIKDYQNIKNTAKIQEIILSGFGGTELMPGINFVAQNYNQFPTLILTDGYTDTLDLSSLKKNVLIVTAGEECPISRSNGKLKQIIVEDTK